jgi:hypothetical protein
MDGGIISLTRTCSRFGSYGQIQILTKRVLRYKAVLCYQVTILLSYILPGVAVPWLKRLVAGLSPRRPVFASGSIHVGFVVDKVALGQVFLRVLRFSPVNIIPPLLHIYLSPPHEVCDSSDLTAHYHHLGPKLQSSFLTQHFGWKQNKKVNVYIYYYQATTVLSYKMTQYSYKEYTRGTCSPRFENPWCRKSLHANVDGYITHEQNFLLLLFLTRFYIAQYVDPMIHTELRNGISTCTAPVSLKMAHFWP